MYFALQKCYPTREQYGDTLLFCRHCSTLFWKVSCGRGLAAGRHSLSSAQGAQASKQEAVVEACGVVCPRQGGSRYPGVRIRVMRMAVLPEVTWRVGHVPWEAGSRSAAPSGLPWRRLRLLLAFRVLGLRKDDLCSPAPQIWPLFHSCPAPPELLGGAPHCFPARLPASLLRAPYTSKRAFSLYLVRTPQTLVAYQV